LGAIALTGAFLWANGYHISEFSGGQRIWDSGTFTYPRYHIEVGSAPLWRSGEYSFAVNGLPPDPLDLKLTVAGDGNFQRDRFESLSTAVSVAITESGGRTKCEANGRLSNAKSRIDENGWVLASSVSQLSFWNPSCLNVPMKRSVLYLVKVRVSEVDPKSPQFTGLVMLDGGGIELP
jgi:hypothetical protein